MLATTADVAARLGRELTESETTPAAGLLTEASALVAGYLRRDWTALDDVPDAVRVVVSRVVARALTGASTSTLPDGAQSFGSALGPLTHQVQLSPDVVVGSVWLSRTDKTTLAPYNRRYAANVPMWEGGW